MMTTLTTVGYGDYLAVNVSEYAMICIIMLIGTGVFAYVMGSVNSVIEDYQELSSGDDKMSELNTFLDKIEALHGKIPGETKAKIFEHYIYYWKNDRLGSLAKSFWLDDESDLTSFNQEYIAELPDETVLKI
jgi:hypothetical protein